MGEEENFAVDPMNGKIVLQVRKNKNIEVALEKMEEKKKRRREEAESEIDMISNLDFPNFEDEKEETEEETYQRRIRDFQKEMERKKGEWKKKMEMDVRL